MRRVTTYAREALPKLEGEGLSKTIYLIACLWRSCEAMTLAIQIFSHITKLEPAESALGSAAVLNVAGLHLLEAKGAAVFNFNRAQQFFARTHERLRETYGPDDLLVQEEEAWLAEFIEIKYSAELNGWREWRVLAEENALDDMEAASRFDEELYVLHAAMMAKLNPPEEEEKSPKTSPGPQTKGKRGPKPSYARPSRGGRRASPKRGSPKSPKVGASLGASPKKKEAL